jgi:hypothetical protein
MSDKRGGEHTGTNLESGSREEGAYLGLDRDVDPLINRALEIIEPPAAQKVWCRTNIVWSIGRVIDAARVVSSKKRRDKLVIVARSLRKIRREIEKNGTYLPFPLPVSPIPASPEQVEKWNQEVEMSQKDLRRRRRLLEGFVKELDRSSAGVDQLSKGSKPKRSGGKKDNQKREAALNAFILLRAFGDKQPTLTMNGAFPKLADALYEAATGKNADLYSQCRALHESIRGSGAKHR